MPWVMNLASRSLGRWRGAPSAVSRGPGAPSRARPDAAATHLAAAQRAFSDLKVPFYAARAAKLADNLREAAQGPLELKKGG